MIFKASSWNGFVTSELNYLTVSVLLKFSGDPLAFSSASGFSLKRKINKLVNQL